MSKSSGSKGRSRRREKKRARDEAAPARAEQAQASAQEATHRRIVSLLIPLFLASGATSLVYETIWARQLQLVIGTTAVAISIVLAAFMAGLAMGAFAAARWAPRVAQPLRAYAALEGFIGLYALVFPLLLAWMTPVYLAIWRAIEPGPTLFSAIRFLLIGILLLPPTVCMGATLPLLARFVTSHGEEAGYQVGRLYGVNTLGAVLGTGLAGFVLLPAIGLAATTWSTAVANGLLALAAVALARRSTAGAEAGPEETPEPTASAKPQPEAIPAAEPLGIVFVVATAIAAMAGFASLVYEVAWFRLMSLTIGGSAYSFTLMLLAFLLGIGLGGWMAGRATDRIHAAGGQAAVLRRVAWLQVGVGALSWAAMYLYGQLPFSFLRLYDLVGGHSRPLLVCSLLLALLIMTPPALLMGASFPFLVRTAARAPSGLSRPVGLLYGANTLGAIGGAALGSLLLLPVLHVTGTVLLAVSVNLAAAVVATAAASPDGVRSGRFARWAVAATAAVLIVHWQKPPWDPMLMTAGVYKYASDMDDRSRQGLIEYAIDPYEMLFYDEGLSSVVTVARDRKDDNIWLANNGKVDASSQRDLETQVLLAQLPLIFRPDAENILCIGLASGITAGSISLAPAAETIDLVEIEPVIVAASHYFDHVNRRPLEDPRSRLVLNDARNHMLLTPDGSYDLVISEPSNPWLTGVSNLFTREFFALGKRKLRPGGVWSQWVQLYGMSGTDLASVLATFNATYEHVVLFRIDESDLVLLGSETDLELARIGTFFDRDDVDLEDLQKIGFAQRERILGLYQAGSARIAMLVGDVTFNTDDNMRIELSAPLNLHESTRGDNVRTIENLAEIPLAQVPGRNGLILLAQTYAQRDVTWRRTLALLEEGMRRYPEDQELARVHQRVVEQEGHKD